MEINTGNGASPPVVMKVSSVPSGTDHKHTQVKAPEVEKPTVTQEALKEVTKELENAEAKVAVSPPLVTADILFHTFIDGMAYGMKVLNTGEKQVYPEPPAGVSLTGNATDIES